MGLNEQDIYDLRIWFEEALKRSTKKEEKNVNEKKSTR